MNLNNAVVSWDHPEKGVWLNNLRQYNYQGATVLVGDTALAAQVVASRFLFGEAKKELFRHAMSDLLAHTSEFLFLGWPEVTECVILRGADHVRPPNMSELLRRKTVRTAPRFKRKEISPGNWTAELFVKESENLDSLFRANRVLIEDGCGAGGSTGVATLWLLKTKNPGFAEATFLCPIMGDIALEKIVAQARRLNIRLTIVCFGVYKVMSIGWKGKTDTDIIIPNDETEIVGSNILAIPARQILAYDTLYQPDGGRGPCIVGDVGESMSDDPQEVERYIRMTVEEWREFCETPVPESLLAAIPRV